MPSEENEDMSNGLQALQGETTDSVYQQMTPQEVMANNLDSITVAKRAIIKYSLEFKTPNLIVVNYKEINFEVAVQWHDDFLTRGLTEDISEAANAGLSTAVLQPLHNTLVRTDYGGIATDDTRNTILEVLGEVTYKTKKGDPVSRLSRVDKLLEQISATEGLLASAQVRMRTLESPSAVPHGETKDMTYGSKVEQATQAQKIEELEADINKKWAEVDKHLAILTEAIPIDDTGWLTVLPEHILDIVSFNTKSEAASDEDDE